MAPRKLPKDALLTEILKKVSSAKTKAEKVALLQEYNNPGLRALLIINFDESLQFLLPEGEVPYSPNDAPAGTEHTSLYQEAKRLWHFVKGADEKLSKTRKEVMFIQMLEGLQADEAKLLVNVKEKSLNKVYKGLTDSVVKEAFGWNADYKTS